MVFFICFTIKAAAQNRGKPLFLILQNQPMQFELNCSQLHKINESATANGVLNFIEKSMIEGRD
jgi:hypothetical protein